jgi:LysR family transcriptional regulator, low CO2-responsive transcriptional regulator
MIDVTVRQLEVFKEVVDFGNFSRAAMTLQISQPSVSAHIRALEARLTTPLFERRRGSRPKLTGPGEKIYAYACEVLELTEQVSSEIRILKTETSKTLSVSAQRYFVDTLLVKMIANFSQARKEINILANVGVMEDVLVQLREGIVDLGLFVARGPISDIPSEVLGKHRLLIVGAPNHPLAGRRQVKPKELTDHPFIGPLKGSAYNDIIEDAMAEIGIHDYSVKSRSQNPAIMKELVKSSTALLCCLEAVAAPELKSMRLVEIQIDGPHLNMEMRLARSPVRDISEISKKFTDYLFDLKDEGFFKSTTPSSELWEASIEDALD